jgi:hypothetical protein
MTTTFLPWLELAVCVDVIGLAAQRSHAMAYPLLPRKQISVSAIGTSTLARFRHSADEAVDPISLEAAMQGFGRVRCGNCSAKSLGSHKLSDAC